MVFYRKYRPQTISELDLETVREKLTAILKSSFPHAFLFSGPKGLGKTSAARIVAKAINCEKNSKLKTQNSKLQVKTQKFKKTGKKSENEAIEPCNACDVCTSITNGSAIDVLEIDAASNRGIDEIRDLRERIKFAPASLSHKVYIIDEVHMLTTEAFNALLKTLEEPPAHAIFILCTTEPWRLPQTIVSRTFNVLFEKPSNQEVARSLKRVVAGEGLDIPDDVVNSIGEVSEGSFRDAAKILEELTISAGKKITSDTFEKQFKIQSIEKEVKDFLLSLSGKDAKGALQVLDRLSARGVDFKLVTEQIVDLLREKLLGKANNRKAEKTDLDIASLEKLITQFSEAYKDIKFSVLPQLPLELVVVRWCVLENGKLENAEKDSKRFDLKEESGIKRSNLKTGKEPTDNNSFLSRLVEKVKRDNHSIAGVLRGCRVVDMNEDEVTLETNYKFHKDKLDEPNNRAVIEKRAGEILGRKVVVKCSIH